MTSAESALAVCVVGLACFIGGQAVGGHRADARDEAGRVIGYASATGVLRSTEPTEEFGTAAPDMLVRDEAVAASSPIQSPADRRRRLSEGAAGTYIDDILTARDSTVVRWPDRSTRPLRVWISELETLEGWNPDFVPAIRDAFDTWTQTGIPVRFTFIRDSASADVHVRFIEQFANGISGKTVWSRNTAWWLVASDIQLALAHPNGGTITPPQMRAIALHEVGHLLGLDHANDAEHIMSARIRVRELTAEDRATVRLVYGVEAGRVGRE